MGVSWGQPLPSVGAGWHVAHSTDERFPSTKERHYFSVSFYLKYVPAPLSSGSFLAGQKSGNIMMVGRCGNIFERSMS